MKPNFSIKIAISIALSIVLVHSSAWAKGITTSFPLLTLITKDLVPPNIPIRTLTASAEEAHHFEMTPKILIELQNQDLIIINGLNFEHWVDSIKTNLPKTLKIINATAGIKPLVLDHQEVDPHAWHDPQNLKKYIDNIQAALVTQYPEHQATINTRSKILKDRTQKLFEEYSQKFKGLNKNLTLVTAHDSLNYFAHAYGFNSLSLYDNHHGENLSPRQLTEKLKEIKKQKHRLFLLDGSDTDSNLKSWAQKTNSAVIGIIWSDGLPKTNPPQDILDYLEHNAKLVFESQQKE